MSIDKSLLSGSTSMLLLTLIEERDMYGYQLIEELSRRSDDTFRFKAGTLYPLLHDLELRGMISAYEMTAETGRKRKYYTITASGRSLLAEKQAEWRLFSTAVEHVLTGGACFDNA